MAKKAVLPQPTDKYDPDHERLRNREIEEFARAANQKLSELESRIQVLEATVVTLDARLAVLEP
jgi:hypothetical protein